MAKIRESVLSDEELAVVVRQHRRLIALRIYEQMDPRFHVVHTGYEKPRVLGYTKIEPWNFSALSANGYKDYRDVVPERRGQKICI